MTSDETHLRRVPDFVFQWDKNHTVTALELNLHVVCVSVSHPSNVYLLVLGMSRISINPWFPAEKVKHERTRRYANDTNTKPRLSNILVYVRLICISCTQRNILPCLPVEPATIAFNFLLCLQNTQTRKQMLTKKIWILVQKQLLFKPRCQNASREILLLWILKWKLYYKWTLENIVK